jgi:hypothetical protein
MADDFQRLLARDRRPNHRFDVLGVAYFQDVHANRASPGPYRLCHRITALPPSSGKSGGHKGAIGRRRALLRCARRDTSTMIE